MPIALLSSGKLKSLVRFGLGGVVSSAVAIGGTALLHEMAGMPERIAGAGGLAASLLVNFVVLRFFVFRGTQISVWRQLPMFLATSGVFRALEYAGFFVVNTYLHLQYLLALVVVLGTSFLLKFLVYEGLVFVKKAGTPG
jgi:putative flippase GtrA